MPLPFHTRRMGPPRPIYKSWISLLIVPLLLLPVASTTVAATGDVQVSVFNMPNLNGTGCAGENENLIGIINAISGYTVDGTIVDFVDRDDEPTLASQLAASRFFFMTDMENATLANPDNASFLPDSAVTAFRNWTNSGGVMVMTGTSGDADVRFLNKIYNWDLGNAVGASASEVTANTAGTPFANATGGRALGTPSATDSISPGSVPNFTSMWRTASGTSAVAVIQYGSGYVIYMGWDFFSSGPGVAPNPPCSQNGNDWVTGIVPAALLYASELSQSGLENATTSGGDLKYTFSQSGQAYFLVVPSGSAAPTNLEIKSQADYGAVTVSTSGTAPITATVERVFTVTGLVPAADYTAYLVTEYDDNGTPTFSSQQSVNFSTRPGVPTVVSVNPDAGRVTVTLTPFGTETNFEYSIDGGSTWNSRSPAGTTGAWDISSLSNGVSYDFQFRSAFKTLKSDATSVTTVTPSVAPAFLSALEITPGALSPAFQSQTLTYSASVANTVESVTITPTSNGNSITVAGAAVVSGAESDPISLSVGLNEVTVSVLREVEGAIHTVYTLQVTRQPASPPPVAAGTIATPTPTQAPTVTPRPNPTRRPAVNAPATPSPGATPALTPTITVAPAPRPTATRITTLVIPEREATPGVVFTATNPIPQDLVEALFSPLAYETSASGSPTLPTLTPSQSVAFENGALVQVQLVMTSNGNGYLLQGDNWAVALEATDTRGDPLVLDDSGNIVLNSDRFVQFQGTGFAPGSIIKVWLFSDPSSIADVVADSNGNFTGSAQLPADIPDGEHTVQLNGLSKDGQVRSVSLGVVVQPDVVAAPTLIPVDVAPLWNLLFITAGVVMMFLLVLVARRRLFLAKAKRGMRKEEKAGQRSSKALGKKQKRDSAKEQLLIDEMDPFLAKQVAEANPSQQFPNDSRRKIGAAAPPNRKRFGFKPKDA